MAGITQEFNEKQDFIGPYRVVDYSTRPVTPAQVDKMPADVRHRYMADHQSALILSGAVFDSQDDKTLGDRLVTFRDKEVPVSALIEVGQKLSVPDKVKLVQEIVNGNVEYTSPEKDRDRPRRENAPFKTAGDYAQTSGEMLDNGEGDCEDFAILEADILQRMGVPPEDLKIMSGTVHNDKDGTKFDHVNLAVKTSDKSWDVMELAGKGVKVLPATSYLQQGLQQQYFVPSIAVGMDGQVDDFNIKQPDGAPKNRFDKDYPDAIKAALQPQIQPSVASPATSVAP